MRTFFRAVLIRLSTRLPLAWTGLKLVELKSRVPVALYGLVGDGEVGRELAIWWLLISFAAVGFSVLPAGVITPVARRLWWITAEAILLLAVSAIAMEQPLPDESSRSILVLLTVTAQLLVVLVHQQIHELLVQAGAWIKTIWSNVPLDSDQNRNEQTTIDKGD